MFKRVTAILPLDEETAERDADALLRTVIAVATNGKTAAVRELRDIAGHVWMGRLSAARAAGSVEGTSGQRTKDESLRARVFVRDGFRCTQCGGRAVPRSILVAIHDLYPEEIPYDVHYTRGRTHPAFWAPVPEADHVLAHSRGGFNDLAISLRSTPRATPESPTPRRPTLRTTVRTRPATTGTGSHPSIPRSSRREPGRSGLATTANGRDDMRFSWGNRHRHMIGRPGLLGQCPTYRPGR